MWSLINKHEDIYVDHWDVICALGEDIKVAEQCIMNDRRGDRRLGEEWGDVECFSVISMSYVFVGATTACMSYLNLNCLVWNCLYLTLLTSDARQVIHLQSTSHQLMPVRSVSRMLVLWFSCQLFQGRHLLTHQCDSLEVTGCQLHSVVNISTETYWLTWGCYLCNRAS